MYGLQFREELPEETQRELDALIARYNGFLLTEHNEDGTHNFDLSSLSSETITQLVEAAQGTGQWWKSGPWLLDDPAAADPNAVGLTISLAAGTYNNYAPTGIDTSVVIDINPTGAVTLNGLRAIDGVRNKRIVMLRNSSTTYSITLVHASTSSLAPYRFLLPSSTNVVVGPGQNIWLYYDPSSQRWTAAITGQTSGAVIAASAPTAEVYSAEATWNITDLVTSGNYTMVAAQSGKILVPLKLHVFLTLTNGSSAPSTNQSIQVRYADGTATSTAAQTLTLINGAGAGAVRYSTHLIDPEGFNVASQTTQKTMNSDLVINRASSGTAGNTTAVCRLKLWYAIFTP